MKTFNLKEQAVLLTKLGLRIHPVKGKVPLADDWLECASSKECHIDLWIRDFEAHQTGWGIAVGDDDPYWILDADNSDWLIEELSARKIPAPDGLTVMSGGGSGCHIYVKGRRPYWAKSVKNPRFVSKEKTPSEKANLLEFPHNVIAPWALHPVSGKPYTPSPKWRDREWKLAEFAEGQDGFISFLRDMCFIRKSESSHDLKPIGLAADVSLEKVLDGTELKGKYRSRDGGDRVWLDYHKQFGACCVKGEAHHDADNNRKCGFYYMKSDPSDWGHFCFSPACQGVEGGQRRAAMKFLGIDIADISVPRWRRLFRSKREFNQSPLSFVVNQFIPEEGITGFGGIPGHAKSWILLSVAKAIRNAPCRLWERLVVPKRYEVLYLTPEVGDRAINDRLNRLKMDDDPGFLFRTMSMGKKLPLDAPDLLKACEGRVVFLDTLVRFLDGRDENSSKDIAQLFELIGALIAFGAVAVVVAHHSRKPGEMFPFVMTQECVFRGSGDIAANLSAGHGAYQLDKQTGSKETRVHIECVKPRDFEPLLPFQLVGKPFIDEKGDFKMDRWECGPFDLEKKAYDRAADPEGAKEDPRWGEALKMKREGKLHSEIAERFDITEKTSQRWCDKAERAEEETRKQRGMDSEGQEKEDI